MPARRGSAPPRSETPRDGRGEPRFWLAGVAGLTVAVAAFLLARLHAWPPNEDEALVFFVSRQPFGDLFDTVISERGGAPLHFLLAHLALLASPSLTALRLISVVFAVASIPIVAVLIARLADRRTALLATLIVAASWTTLFHGIYARMYGLFLFLSALSFLLLLRAVERDSRGRWAAWAVSAVALVATQPYGTLVLVVQAGYVFARGRRRRRPLRRAAVSFLLVAIGCTPLLLTYARLASRFDVGAGGGGNSRLGSPLDVLGYLWSVLGDFTAGWEAVAVPVALLALAGIAVLVRTRPGAASLAIAVVVVPALALLVARSGSGIFLETRHLIFALPFFAMALAAGILWAGRLAGPAVPLVALATAILVSSELAWGWSRTPWLYAGEPDQRVEARQEAADWLAETSRADDVLFGYEPTYLDAGKAGAPFGDLFVPRADPRLAIRTVREAATPLGRGVWVLDASDERVVERVRLEIPELTPGEGFESRAFGPFLIIRTREPVAGVRAYFEDTLLVQELSRGLDIGDAGVNLATARTALALLRDRSVPSSDAVEHLLGRQHQARGGARPRPRLESLGRDEGGSWRVIAGQEPRVLPEGH